MISKKPEDGELVTVWVYGCARAHVCMAECVCMCLSFCVCLSLKLSGHLLCHCRSSLGDDAGRDDDRMESDGLTMQQREHMSFLGDASNVRLDDLATLTLSDNDLLPEGVTVEDLAVFEQMYMEHCQVGQNRLRYRGATYVL